MAVGDITTIPIKDGAGTTRQVPFEEQADGSLAPVHFSRGAEGAVLATQTTLAAVLSELEAQNRGTDAEPTVARLSGSTVAKVERFTSLASAQSFTPSAGATKARVYCETGEVSVRDDGTTATSTNGVPIGAGAYEDFWNPGSGSIIEVDAGSVARVVYY